MTIYLDFDGTVVEHHYPAVAPSPDVTGSGDDGKTYTMDKMRFSKKDQKDTIHYNSKITVSNIPAKAYG